MAMMMRRRALLVTALAAAVTRADAQDAEAGDRVVCVSKQINEFIYAIGAEGDLVARDLTSIYPPEITKLPSVGYHRALSAEGILSMQPTVFLTDGNVGPNAVLDRLREVGIPIVVMDPGLTLDGAEALMTRLGHYFHREDATAKVLATWQGRMAAVERDAAKFQGQPHPRVLVMHFGQEGNTYLALGNGGPSEQVIKWAGGENTIARIGGMTRLTPEMIAQAAPDIIIATDVGFDRYGSAAKFAELPGVGLTPAGKALRIYRVQEDDLMYFGPRTPDAVARMTAFLHP